MLRRRKNSQWEQSAQGGVRVTPAHASGAQQQQGAWQTKGMRQTQGASQVLSTPQTVGVRQASGVSHKPVGQHKPIARKTMSTRQRATMILGVIALLLGMCIFAYPSVSNYFFQQAQGKLIQLQAAAVSDTNQETLDAMYAEAVEYNERLFNTHTVITDPFDESTSLVTDEEYESLLNLESDGIMATITIPAIDVQLVIYHGTSNEVLQQGVGHLQGSSLPVGGESTHAVLAGHTGLPNAQIFDNIDQLEVGDYFIIAVLGEELAYRITSIEVVLPEETDSLVIQEGEDLVTLVTCTPYGVNSHRLLVHAERTDIPDEWLEGDTTVSISTVDRSLLPSILIGLALALAIIIMWRLISRLRKRRATKRAAKQAAFVGEAVRRSGGGVGAAGGVVGAGAGAGVRAGTGGLAPPGVVPGAVRDMGSVLPRTDAKPAQSGAGMEPAQPGAMHDASSLYGGGA